MCVWWGPKWENFQDMFHSRSRTLWIPIDDNVDFRQCLESCTFLHCKSDRVKVSNCALQRTRDEMLRYDVCQIWLQSARWFRSGTVILWTCILGYFLRVHFYRELFDSAIFIGFWLGGGGRGVRFRLGWKKLHLQEKSYLMQKASKTRV